MPFVPDQRGGNRFVSNGEALRGGRRSFASDLLNTQRDQLSRLNSQSVQDASSLSSRGANPFVAQRLAARERTNAQAGVMRETQAQIQARQDRLEALDREDQAARAREVERWVGTGLSAAGSIAGMIPGIASAAPAANGLAGAVQGGAQGGVGGALGGLMSGLGGGAAALAPQGAAQAQGQPGALATAPVAQMQPQAQPAPMGQPVETPEERARRLAMQRGY